MKRIAFGLFFGLLVVMLSCKTVNQKEAVSELRASDGSPKVCGAIRGNGNLIMAHYGALGRYHEDYPPLDGFAGGSSGSITTFIYESIHMNPLLKQCEGRPCTAEETRLRMSFLLKSLLGYADAFKQSDEIQALIYMFKGIETLRKKFQDKDFLALMESNPSKAAAAMEELLSKSGEFTGLFNQELLIPFKSGSMSNPAFHLAQLKTNAEKFGSWEATDASIFFFPGFFNWSEFADRIGRVADFYAGYGSYYPKAAMDQLLSTCSGPMKGKLWNDPIPFEIGKTCQDTLVSLIGSYRQQNRLDTKGPHRINEPIGKGMLAIAPTSVLMGDSIKTYKAAKADYAAGKDLNFTPNFADIRAGYFGQDDTLNRIASNPRGYTDLRTQKFLALGPQPWKTILSTSPAEPSLSDIRPISSQLFSVGGWIDLSPSLILHNAGCDEVVYFTRYAVMGANGFAGSIIQLLGASPREIDDLINPDPNRQPPSSFSLANSESNAVWCTDWDNTAATDINQHFAVAYNAKFMTDQGYWIDAPSAPSIMQGGEGRSACVK